MAATPQCHGMGSLCLSRLASPGVQGLRRRGGNAGQPGAGRGVASWGPGWPRCGSWALPARKVAAPGLCAAGHAINIL